MKQLNFCTDSDLPLSYIVQERNKEHLLESTSGGFTGFICEYVLSRGGYVCAACYEEGCAVKHVIIHDTDKDASFRGSKYVQSNLNNTFTEIKTLLNRQYIVLFVGTLCQVEGLQNYLNKDYINLITVSLLCAGVPSPKLWNDYLRLQERKYNSKISYANFRNKTYGYQASTLKLKFESGACYSKSGRLDPIMKLFLDGTSKRPSCYTCRFKGVERCCDFTVYDCWHFKELTNMKDNDRGYTNIIAHTGKAVEFLNEIGSYLDIYPCDLNRAVALDGSMFYGLPFKSAERENFYKLFAEKGIEYCTDKYTSTSPVDVAIEQLKGPLYRLGIIRLAKKIKWAIAKTT